MLSCLLMLLATGACVVFFVEVFFFASSIVSLYFGWLSWFVGFATYVLLLTWFAVMSLEMFVVVDCMFGSVICLLSRVCRAARAIAALKGHPACKFQLLPLGFPTQQHTALNT